MQQYSLKLTFTTPLLGTAPLNEAVYQTYIASKAPAGVNGAAETETIEDLDIKGRTGFHRDELNRPMLLDYQIRGYFKEAWRACKPMPFSKSAALKAGASNIDKFLFVFGGGGDYRDNRYIRLIVPVNAKEDVYERPLRAQTMQGPRVALAASEMVPEMTRAEIKLHVLAPTVITEPLLREWLDYGKYLGIGQWRSGSFGRFAYTLAAYTPTGTGIA